MSKTKKKSKHQSDSSDSSSSSDSSPEKYKSNKKSKWDSPNRQSSSSRRKERDRSPEESRSRHREEDSRHKYRSDERRNERRKSPDRRDRDRKDYEKERRRSRSRDRDRNRDDRKRSNWDNNRNRRRRDDEEDDANYEWGKKDSRRDQDEKVEEKQKPDFGLSGKLTEESNKVHGIVIKYAEPPEAKKPKRRWRLYPFKGETALPVLYIHRQSGYLIGRDRKICDIAVDHPSCSKQHAALQFRLVPYEREDGTTGKRVRPYLIDLESANGTFVNNNKIEARKYMELLEKDVIKFGFSSREYVLLHESSKEDAEDDDFAEPDDNEDETKDVKVKEEAV